MFKSSLRAALLLGHHGCGNTSTLGPLQGIGPGVVGHHQGNFAVGDATGGLCIQKGLTLETLPLEDYRAVCPDFDEGVYGAISLEKCVGGRKVLGGPAPENVKAQAQRVLGLLEKEGN